jgi:asparagine synthase (glutamine-hydrolysing)
MCGLAGAAGLVDDDVVTAVRRMNDAQSHRGPDSQGLWTSGADAPFEVSLGHRRLAIIDLSPAGAQPMRNVGTGDVVVFNGEIYNFGDLRRELEAAGARFFSNSDTEVILHAYERWGLDSVRRFRGIFAFALWDARRRQLHLVRDPMGVKPLYWTVRGRTVYFASELRALLAAGVDRRLDPNAVASFLWHGFVVGPQTMIENVQLLPAASTVTLAEGALRPTPASYWSLPPAGPHTTTPSSVTQTLRDTIRMQLVSDVPLGVFLSGGVDSTAVAALACETSGADVRTFNIGFDEPELDESRHALAVAKALGTQHASLRIGEAEFHHQLPRALEGIDQPTFDGINTYLVSRAVREAGMTVALAGVGGDELFGGYKSFVDLPRAARIAPLLAPMGPVARSLTETVTRLALMAGLTPPQTRWGKVADVLSSKGDFVDLYQAEYALFSTAFFAKLSAPLKGRINLTSGLTAGQRAACEAVVDTRHPLHSIASLELGSFVRERLVRDTDAASMAVSLELRVPFLDHVVIEQVARLSETDRFMPLRRKFILRNATFSKVDPKIFERPKSGFVLPIDAWCRRGMREQMNSVYHDEALCERVGVDAKAVQALWRSFLEETPGLYWSRIWAIFILLDWCSRHRVTL